MPEILTESFCERCGTRYTFEAVTPKARPLTKLKILTRGLRNYVLSDETTLDEALAAARSEERREISAQQLDAFHRTFSFCMSCRQYTCANCWNEVEGRCLTCVPNLGAGQAPEVAPPLSAAVAGSSGLPGAVLEAPARGGHGHAAPTIDASAWPTVDLRREPAARGRSPEAPPELPPAPAGPVVETTAAAVEEPASAPDSRREAAPEPAATDGPAPAAELTAAVEPAAAAAGAAESAPAATPTPSAAEPIEAAPPAPEPPPSPLALPAPTAPASEAGVVARPTPDRVETQVWRIVAPDTTPGAEPTGRSPVAWPAPPPRPAASPPFAPSPPAAADVVWAVSSRDVLNRPGSGVQACVSCGLPLSATARFCRRCGSRQG